jgi:hypothetical protein
MRIPETFFEAGGGFVKKDFLRLKEDEEVPL